MMRKPPRSRRRVAPGVLIVVAVLVTGWGVARRAMGAEAALPPERTFSNAPFVHKIYLRDEEGNAINPPKVGPDGKALGEDPGKPMSQYATCGKCHSDKDTMLTGWHSNASDPRAPKGRPGEPWILADVQTRTQLPLSYRKWDGTHHPHDVGLSDFKFALNFGRHLPGGDALLKSDDLRFRMSGKFEFDCLVCHTTDNGYDPVDRYLQVNDEVQNFKWASTYAAGLGKVIGQAVKLKDNWDPADPNARPAPKIAFDRGRFDAENKVLFNVERRIPNERCYYCHTSVGSGPLPGGDAHGGPAAPAGDAIAPKPAKGGVAFRQNLENRFRHDRDIHILKGMLCVDCHRNGADHMTTRGYEGEYADRVAAYGADKVDKTITTLSCVGCHYGTDGPAGTTPQAGLPAVEPHGKPENLGGRVAAPRPQHKGLPTLHFDKISCTACHSGPYPDDATTMVQTSLAHRLGLPHHRHVDDASPIIQQPVFLRVDKAGKPAADDAKDAKITPHKVLYPSFWGRLNGDTITPMTPELVLAAVGKSAARKLFEDAPDAKEVEEHKPLEKDKIIQALEKIAAYQPPAPEPKLAAPAATVPAATQGATTKPATTQTAAGPAVPAYHTGEPVYVTGGKAYRRSKDGKSLESFDNAAAKPYAWALAHDVRGAQQSLGARGCTDCHASGAPLFDSTVSSASVIPAASVTQPMHAVRGDTMGALAAFAATYPMRPILVFTGYACAIVLGLVLLNYGTRAVSRIGRRK
ncbi:MAG TPA: hypothetical protein VK986_09635 [Tepidisphaeraceae bacterium]|nr:hypothetical protein [Tepidisphaeraceae bacterium]